MASAAAGPLVHLRPLRGGGGHRPDSPLPRRPPFLATTLTTHASIVAVSHPVTFPAPVAAALGVVAASAALAEQVTQHKRHKQESPPWPSTTRERAVNWIAVAVDVAWFSHALMVHHDHDFNTRFGSLGKATLPTVRPLRNRYHPDQPPTPQPPTAHNPGLGLVLAGYAALFAGSAGPTGLRNVAVAGSAALSLAKCAVFLSCVAAEPFLGLGVARWVPVLLVTIAVGQWPTLEGIIRDSGELRGMVPRRWSLPTMGGGQVTHATADHAPPLRVKGMVVRGDAASWASLPAAPTEQEEIDNAEASCAEAAAEGDVDVGAAYDYNLGLLKMNLRHDIDGAEALCRAADPGNAYAHCTLGLLLEIERLDIDGAEAAYRAAIEADPGFAAAHFNLGALLKEHRQNIGAAEAAYRAAIAACAGNAPAHFHTNLGILLTEKERNDIDGAIAAYRAAITAEPEAASQAHFNLGLLLEKERKDVDGAEAAYRAAIAADPGYAKAHFNLSLLLKNERKDIDGAEAAFRATIAADPGHTDAHGHLGNLLIERAQQTDEAGGVRHGAEAALFDEVAEHYTFAVGPEHASVRGLKAHAARVRAGRV